MQGERERENGGKPSDAQEHAKASPKPLRGQALACMDVSLMGPAGGGLLLGAPQLGVVAVPLAASRLTPPGTLVLDSGGIPDDGSLYRGQSTYYFGSWAMAHLARRAPGPARDGCADDQMVAPLRAVLAAPPRSVFPLHLL